MLVEIYVLIKLNYLVSSSHAIRVHLCLHISFIYLTMIFLLNDISLEFIYHWEFYCPEMI